MLIYLPFYLEDKSFAILQYAEHGKSVRITQAFFEKFDLTPEGLQKHLSELERHNLIRKIVSDKIMVGYKATPTGIALLAEGMRENVTR